MVFHKVKEGIQCDIPFKEMVDMGINNMEMLQHPAVSSGMVQFILQEAPNHIEFDMEEFNHKMLAIDASVNAQEECVSFIIKPVDLADAGIPNADELMECIRDIEDAYRHMETDEDYDDEPEETNNGTAVLCCEFNKLDEAIKVCKMITSFNDKRNCVVKNKDKYYVILYTTKEMSEKLLIRLADFCSISTNTMRVCYLLEHGKQIAGGKDCFKQLAQFA